MNLEKENSDLRAQCGGMQMEIDELREKLALHESKAVAYQQIDEETGKPVWDEASFAGDPSQFELSRPLYDRPSETLQAQVGAWMDQCFLPSLYSNMTERGDRLLEEVLELLQAHGYDPKRVATLVDYVYGRPAGESGQEVGGVMITLAGFCYIAGLDMHMEGARELARINLPEVMAKIRAKQTAKNALHFDTPLPGAVSSES